MARFGVEGSMAHRALVRPVRQSFAPFQRPPSTSSIYTKALRIQSCRDIPNRPVRPPPLYRSFTTLETPVEKFRKAVDKARHDHPVLLPFLVVACFGAVSLLA